MTLGNSTTEARHREIQTESAAGYYTPMKQCFGARCRGRRKSIGQFQAGRSVCIRCEKLEVKP